MARYHSQTHTLGTDPGSHSHFVIILFNSPNLTEHYSVYSFHRAKDIKCYSLWLLNYFVRLSRERGRDRRARNVSESVACDPLFSVWLLSLLCQTAANEDDSSLMKTCGKAISKLLCWLWKQFVVQIPRDWIWIPPMLVYLPPVTGQ